MLKDTDNKYQIELILYKQFICVRANPLINDVS